MSKRKYHVVGFDRSTVINTTVTAHELLAVETTKDPYEYLNALSEDDDAILDLHVGQCLYVRLNRDSPEAIGVIRRIY